MKIPNIKPAKGSILKRLKVKVKAKKNPFKF